MNHDSAISTLLTFHQRAAIFHALKAEVRSNIDLLSRLQYTTTNEGIVRMGFLEKEIQDIIEVLEITLKKNQDVGADHFGHLSSIELEELLRKFKGLSNVFQVKGA